MFRLPVVLADCVAKDLPTVARVLAAPLTRQHVARALGNGVEREQPSVSTVVFQPPYVPVETGVPQPAFMAYPVPGVVGANGTQRTSLFGGGGRPYHTLAGGNGWARHLHTGPHRWIAQDDGLRRTLANVARVHPDDHHAVIEEAPVQPAPIENQGGVPVQQAEFSYNGTTVRLEDLQQRIRDIRAHWIADLVFRGIAAFPGAQPVTDSIHNYTMTEGPHLEALVVLKALADAFGTEMVVHHSATRRAFVSRDDLEKTVAIDKARFLRQNWHVVKTLGDADSGKLTVIVAYGPDALSAKDLDDLSLSCAGLAQFKTYYLPSQALQDNAKEFALYRRVIEKGFGSLSEEEQLLFLCAKEIPMEIKGELYKTDYPVLSPEGEVVNHLAVMFKNGLPVPLISEVFNALGLDMNQLQTGPYMAQQSPYCGEHSVSALGVSHHGIRSSALYTEFVGLEPHTVDSLHTQMMERLRTEYPDRVESEDADHMVFQDSEGQAQILWKTDQAFAKEELFKANVIYSSLKGGVFEKPKGVFSKESTVYYNTDFTTGNAARLFFSTSQSVVRAVVELAEKTGKTAADLGENFMEMVTYLQKNEVPIPGSVVTFLDASR